MKQQAFVQISTFKTKEMNYLALMKMILLVRIAEKRIRGVYMKNESNRSVKIIAGILAAILFMACFTTACQPTPQGNIVVDKNNLKEQISENTTESQKVNEDGTTIINYDWPLSYSTGLDELTNFSINAKVITSDAKYYPVKTAREAAYSASQIEAIINIFADGTELYRCEDVINTKETIEEQIVMQKRLISDVQSGNNKAFAGSIEQLNTYLDELETKFKSAPSQASLIPVNNYSESLNANGDLQLASIDNGMNFIVSNNNYQFIRFYINPCEDTIALQDEETINTISLSRADAEKQAREIIDSLGYDYMSLSETSAGVYLADYSENNENNESSVYCFYFTRAIDGTPINYEETNTASLPPSGGEERIYSESWPYEFISIAIGQSGVQEIIINGNLEITDTVSENVKLLDFNEMIKKATSAIKQKYVSYSDAGQMNEERKYNIDTIKLGYMQVASQDNPDEFMIIPVWDFFGTESFNGEELPRRPHSYLTINAINGSIIDRRFGY